MEYGYGLILQKTFCINERYVRIENLTEKNNFKRSWAILQL